MRTLMPLPFYLPLLKATHYAIGFLKWTVMDFLHLEKYTIHHRVELVEDCIEPPTRA